jgi:DNA-binding response OmpR family regulator
MNKPSDCARRVLVVDDDAGIQALYRILLKRLGFDSDIAADGEQALSCLRKANYGAIVLDLMLPDPNGFEILRHVKCLNRDLSKRVIVVTAASLQMLEFFDHTTVRKVLRKPFDINELCSELLACMNENAGSDSASGDGSADC